MPYSTDVLIDKVKEKPEITEIYATIITEREIHKSMVIGKNGQTIKRIGINSRKKIGELTQKKVFLKLNASIKKGWDKNEDIIKKINNY
nr:KH domain-containing protein [uncultured Campylobacter sp.]